MRTVRTAALAAALALMAGGEGLAQVAVGGASEAWGLRAPALAEAPCAPPRLAEEARQGVWPEGQAGRLEQAPLWSWQEPVPRSGPWGWQAPPRGREEGQGLRTLPWHGEAPPLVERGPWMGPPVVPRAMPWTAPEGR